MTVRRKTTAAACVLALALAGCGKADVELGVEEPAREGLAIPLEGIEYNVFITRELNTKLPPDDAYYNGPDPGEGQTYYGVFLQACNNSKKDTHTTAGEFKVIDNQGREFEPIELPEDNAFAYNVRTLDPEQCIPESGSVAQLGPTAGSMLLFKLPLAVTENRPLELEVVGEKPDEHITFELDI